MASLLRKGILRRHQSYTVRILGKEKNFYFVGLTEDGKRIIYKDIDDGFKQKTMPALWVDKENTRKINR